MLYRHAYSQSLKTGSVRWFSKREEAVGRFQVVHDKSPGKPVRSRLKQTPREEAVLNCLVQRLTYTAIADQLDIGIDIIRNYIRRICKKLQVQSRTEAVEYLGH